MFLLSKAGARADLSCKLHKKGLRQRSACLERLIYFLIYLCQAALCISSRGFPASSHPHNFIFTQMETGTTILMRDYSALPSQVFLGNMYIFFKRFHSHFFPPLYQAILMQNALKQRERSLWQWLWLQVPGGGSALRMKHVNPELIYSVSICHDFEMMKPSAV